MNFLSNKENFLVTGYGRSGTDFLHRLMNRSDSWVINHEARGGLDETEYFKGEWLPEAIANEFDRNLYGEVNSRLRYFLFRIPVSRVGIIVRDPQEIFMSIMNRKGYHKRFEFFIRDIVRSYQNFYDYLSCRGGLVVEFGQMTTDPDYCQKVIEYFGVDDVKVAYEDVEKKVNSNRKMKFKTFEDLPGKIKDEFQKVEWDRLVNGVLSSGERL